MQLNTMLKRLHSFRQLWGGIGSFSLRRQCPGSWLFNYVLARRALRRGDPDVHCWSDRDQPNPLFDCQVWIRCQGSCGDDIGVLVRVGDLCGCVWDFIPIGRRCTADSSRALDDPVVRRPKSTSLLTRVSPGAIKSERLLNELEARTEDVQLGAIAVLVDATDP